MSGVQDSNGVQWERCNVCTKYVRLTNLGYEPPSVKHQHGRDICLTCTNAHEDIESIEPADEWLAQYESQS